MPLRSFGAGFAGAAVATVVALASPAVGLEVARTGAAVRATSGLRRWGSATPRTSFSHTEVWSQKPILVSEAKGGASDEKSSVHRSIFEGWTIHHVFGTIIFGSFALSMCLVVPTVREQNKFFEENVAGSGDTFGEYMSYRFADWFTSALYAPSVVLLFVTLALIVVGAVAYALMVGGSPSHALWRIFVWSTGSPAEGEVSGGGRFLGTIVTVCGLIILSLLLGIVTEVFGSKMKEIKQGLTRVVEGGHVVILGYTECTRCLLEELGKAKESDNGGVFVILAQEDKEEVEAALSGGSLDLRGSRVIVRSGNPHVIRDLQKVAAGSASQIVVLADTSIPPEDADAKSLRTLLALQTKGWPKNGRIVVQCVSEANKELFKDLYGEGSHKIEVVVVGNIVAKLMAASLRQHGLAGVFGMMLGFDGDEFYIEEWPQLVGCTFREAVFRFPDAVALGVLTADGECRLNPGWEYVIQEHDQVIVLAEDNDTYAPSDEAWYSTHPQPWQPCTLRQVSLESQGPAKPEKVLIIGWNTKMGALLSSLSGMLPKGSTVDIYSPRPAAERKEDVEALQQQSGVTYTFEIKQMEVDASKVSSYLELSQLNHQQYRGIFILAEFDSERGAADERTMMCLAQLQRINRHKKAPAEYHFDPVVEMCEDSTAEHLKMVGLTNFVHSNSLVSQALAAVTENPSVNSIYADLMSGLTNHFEFRRYEDFLPEGQQLPSELSFWEAAYQVSQCGDISLIAWTAPPEVDAESGEGKAGIFDMNPKDKVTPRPWTDDRLVVIRRSDLTDG